MTQTFDFHTFENGLVLLGEPMPDVQSAAFGLMVPAGAARLPARLAGAGNVIVDWIFRGAGSRNSRQLSDAIDTLGLHRVVSVGSSFLTIGAALEAGNLHAALELYADVLLCPHLDPQQFELARQLAQDEVLGLDDDPRQKVMLKLREQFYPAPLGNSAYGEIETLQRLNPENTAELVNQQFTMGGALLCVAGAYDFRQLVDRIAELFGQAPAHTPAPLSLGECGAACTHLPHDCAQVHIGLMAPTVPMTDPDYYAARVAVSILSGGMGARLFTEVREKRGLCYAIGARYHGMKQAAGVTCYAGTTPDKAQETLDVIRMVFRELDQDITTDELERAKVGLKALLILQSESTSSRAGALGGDYHLLGRVRSIDEIKQSVEAVTIDGIQAFLACHPLTHFTQVTIGPAPVGDPDKG